jgi:hypothetical protein
LLVYTFPNLDKSTKLTSRTRSVAMLDATNDEHLTPNKDIPTLKNTTKGILIWLQSISVKFKIKYEKRMKIHVLFDVWDLII